MTTTGKALMYPSVGNTSANPQGSQFTSEAFEEWDLLETERSVSRSLMDGQGRANRDNLFDGDVYAYGVVVKRNTKERLSLKGIRQTAGMPGLGIGSSMLSLIYNTHYGSSRPGLGLPNPGGG